MIEHERPGNCSHQRRMIKESAQRVKFGEGAAGRVAETRKPIMIEDYLTWNTAHRPRRHAPTVRWSACR